MEIQVAGIKSYRSRHGKIYTYHRKTGKRIKAALGTAEFLAEIEKLNGGAAPATVRSGTLGYLIERYRASPEFERLAPRTRQDYSGIIDYLKPLANDPIAGFTSNKVLEIRDAAFRAHKRRFANYVVQVLKLLFKWAMVRNLMTVNPALAVETLRRPRSMAAANRPWLDSEAETVLLAATGGLRVAIALGMFAGMREGDAISVKLTCYDGEWLRWDQGKTGRLVELPVDPRLKTILDRAIAARKSGDPETLTIGSQCGSYTGKGFQSAFFRLVRKLEATGSVQPGLTFHGLRHTAGKTLADRGADTRMIATLLGHKTLAMAAHYSEGADRRKLATGAIEKLQPRSK